MNATVPCKGKNCGKPILWAKTADGVSIPLDARPAVYRLDEDGRPVRLTNVFVNHFSTCPDANNFTKKKPA